MTRTGSIVFYTGAVLLAAILLALTWWSGPISFDGGLNFSVAQQFGQTGEYARDYAGHYLFPIESDSVFIFVAALFIKLFGNGLIASELPNLFFAVLLCGGLFLVLAGTMHRARAIAGVCLLTLTPGFWSFGFFGYGEFAMMTFVLGSWCLYLRSDRVESNRGFFLSGILLGLAVSIKIVAAITLPAFLIVIVLRPKRDWKRASRTALLFSSGSFLAYGAWELYRFGAMGTDRWTTWWQLRGLAVLDRAAAGGTLADTPGLWEKCGTHLKILAGFYGLPPAVMGGLVILLLALTTLALAMQAWACIRRQPTAGAIPTSFLFTALVASGYLIWWLCLTPTAQAWLRRLMPGLIFAHACLLLGGACLVRRWLQRLRFRFDLLPDLVAATLLIVVLFAWGQAVDVRNRNVATARANYTHLLATLSALPDDSQFYGIGWFGAPQISFYSNRAFQNLAGVALQDVKLGGAYLILDHNALRSIGWPATPKWPLFQQFSYEPLVSTNQAALFRLTGLAPPPPADRPPASWTKSYMAQASKSGVLRGVRTNQMAESLVTGWIAAKEPDRLVFTGAPLAEESYANKLTRVSAPGSLGFRIEIEGCETIEATVPIGKAFRIEVPIKRQPHAAPKVSRLVRIWSSAVRKATGQAGPQDLNQWSYFLESFTLYESPANSS